MKVFHIARAIMLTLATSSLCLPQVLFAAAPGQAPTPQTIDIALADGGVLHGQVVDLQGAPVQGLPVAVKAKDQVAATTTTSADGRFAVKGLKGGVYHVAAGKGQGAYRLWSKGTAPPSANQGAIVYTANGAAAGAGGLKMLLANPVVIAGVVATAVAVPIAVANSRPSSP